MGISSTKSSPKRSRSKLASDLDELLKQRNQLRGIVKSAYDEEAEEVKAAKLKRLEAVGTSLEQLKELDNRLQAFLERNHYNLTRRFSATIKREDGEVKVVRRAIELEMPDGEAPIIDFLLARSGGKRYLTRTWKVNRRALFKAPSSLLTALAPFGVWRGKHRLISVKSAVETKEAKATSLSNKRFNERAY